MVADIEQADKALHGGAGANKVYFQVTRDPVDRYISTFHSKLKCCKDGNPSTPADRSISNPRTRCAGDYNDDWVISELVSKAGPASAAMAALPCLYFDEFATLLQRVHRLKNQYTVDPHLRAQRVEIPLGWLGWVGTIQEIGHVLNGLTHLGLHPIVTKKKHHATGRRVMVDGKWQPWNPTDFGLNILCKLAETEYAELGFNISAGPCWKADHSRRP